jgi:hypothetical protein
MKNNQTRFVSVIASLLLFMLSGVSVKAADWDPKHTWVFFVGLVTWKDKEEFDPFPADIRKDGLLLESIREHGVPADHVVYLKDQAATTAVVQTRFTEFLKRAQPNDTLIVYFEGHGYKDEDDVPYLATYDVSDKIKGWRFNAVPAAIEKNFAGSQAMVVLDNCYSGAMVEAIKGSKRRVKYAVLASSMASQESTQNWTYTEALINGFNGAAFVDANHDGRITLREMGENAEQDMLFGEEQMATTAFLGGFDPNTVIATAPPLADPRIGQRVEGYSENDWYPGYISAVKGDKVKVHYYGYEAGDEEWKTARSIRVPKYNSPFRVGEKVEVSYKKEWYAAHILKIKGGSHYVSYDEYDKDENEWVPSKRIRKVK